MLISVLPQSFLVRYRNLLSSAIFHINTDNLSNLATSKCQRSFSRSAERPFELLRKNLNKRSITSVLQNGCRVPVREGPPKGLFIQVADRKGDLAESLSGHTQSYRGIAQVCKWNTAFFLQCTLAEIFELADCCRLLKQAEINGSLDIEDALSLSSLPRRLQGLVSARIQMGLKEQRQLSNQPSSRQTKALKIACRRKLAWSQKTSQMRK